MCVMIRLLLLGLLLLLLTLGASGCDSVRPSDEPLPSFEALRAEFGGQPPGRGLVRENSGAPYETSATHFTDRDGDLATFVVYLTSEELQTGMTLFLNGVAGPDLQPGTHFETLNVLYGGPGCIGSGGGRLEITAAADSLIAGVFAADISTTTLVPCHRRLSGGFNAVFEPPEE